MQVEKDLANCAMKERLLKHWQGKTGQFGDFQSEGQAQFFALCKLFLLVLMFSACIISQIVILLACVVAFFTISSSIVS